MTSSTGPPSSSRAHVRDDVPLGYVETADDCRPRTLMKTGWTMGTATALTRRVSVVVVTAAMIATMVAAPRAAAEHSEAPSGAGRADARRIALGFNTTCAILDNGNVRCWGNNNQGQVGLGITKTPIGRDETPDSFPTLNVGTGRTVTEVATGEQSTCALLDDASVRCWGGQTFGPSIGVPGSPNRVRAPLDVGPTNVGGPTTAIAVGRYHACALLANGTVRCWGDASKGQLGYGNTNNIGDNETPASAGPVPLGAGRTATAISAGRFHTCALLDNGSIRCWGERDAMTGQAAAIGDNEPASDGPLVEPADLGGNRAVAVGAGNRSTCALAENGDVYCWGQQEGARFSTGTNTNVLVPTQVDLGGKKVKAIGHGFEHVCVVFVDGKLACWGIGADGRLGYANTNNIGDDEPPLSGGFVDVGAGRTVRAVSAGSRATCALLDNTTIRCWGSAANGAIGSGQPLDIGDDETPGQAPTVNFIGTAAFKPLPPARVLDTRPGPDPGPKGIVPRRGSIDVQITGVGGVPTTGVYAVVLNVTIAGSLDRGFVTAYPAGTPRPTASNINVTGPGRTAPNSVIVPLSPTGKITLYAHGGGDLIADVFGYFQQTGSSDTGRLIGITPARVFDTRPDQPAPGPKGKLTAGQTIEVKVTGALGVPSRGVSAVVLNVTAAEATDRGFITVFPGNVIRPGTSNINLSGPGATRPNTVIVPVSPSGTVKFFSQNGAHLLADVTAYFTDATAEDTDDGLFVRFDPTRLLDSRSPNPAPIPAGGETSFAVTGRLGIPTTANAVALNLTATDTLGRGFVTGWPSDENRGNTSNLNVPGAGETIANLAILPLRQPSGRISLFTQKGANLIADASGYFL
jgi:alpha-tubulin suppressor-like RCC1 family protein